MSPIEHLNLLIAREIHRLRARYELSMDELRGLFISDVQVDALLAQPAAASVADPYDWSGAMPALAQRLNLDAVQCGCLMLVLAPELDPRYTTFYAYLNDDVSRRRMTIDLAQRLLGPAALAALAPTGELARAGLIVPAGAPDAPLPLIAWRLSAVARHHLLGLPGCALDGLAWLNRFEPDCAASAQPPALIVAGPPETARRDAARRWADEQGRPSLLASWPVLARGADPIQALREAALAARMEGAALVLDADGAAPPVALPETMQRVPLAIVAQQPKGWAGLLAKRSVRQSTTALPPAAARAAVWREALKATGKSAPPAAVQAAARQFKLSAPSIARAAARAAVAADGRLDAAALTAAARAETATDFGPAAQRVPLQAGWDDLVLPTGAREQLQDFAGAIAHRATVFEDWGFRQVGRAIGNGVAAMFSGGSGTGKTMSAAVIARELGLDLWRVDLAALVSKYIGETEKNLEKLFSASGASDAILFFDEADAVFGKRSEVKDSHDRYANIETAYLLQRLEEHDGVVILATNLSRNLDAAFLRRIPFVIEFPVPDETARALLWRKAIPAQAPLCANVDFRRLARGFELTGGDIRAAAFEAACLAAQRRTAINAGILETTIRRQLLKRGQLPAANGHDPRPLRATLANGATV